MSLFIQRYPVSHVKAKPKSAVFLHGWGFDHRVWLPLVEHLYTLGVWQDYAFYLVDLPGFGQSDDMDWDHFKHALF